MNAMTPKPINDTPMMADDGDHTVANRAAAGGRSVGVVTPKYGGSLFLRNQAVGLPPGDFRRQSADEIVVGR